MADQHPVKQRAKPGRKPASDEPPNKRIAQSREIQRAFRERRANYIRDLETKVQSLESKVEELTKAVEEKDSTSRNPEIEVRLKALETENLILRQLSTPGLSTAALPSAAPVGLSAPADPISLALQNYALYSDFPEVSFGTPTDFSFGSANSLNPPFGGINSFVDLLPFNTENLSTDDLLAQLLEQSSSASNGVNAEATIPQISAFTEYREPRESIKESLKHDCSSSSLQQVVPSKPLPYMTDGEKEEYISREVPSLGETFEELEKIPSLAGQDELLEDLCRAIVMVSIKGGERDKLPSDCPIVAEANPEPEFDATEHLIKVKEKIYNVCTDEDAEQFSSVIRSGWEKQSQFIAEQSTELENE
ncbi:hypothetical protein HDU83_005447 [Entophlyctis luteolus]|nr:hypothetical protein HDU83_005447 [Entophlyctis luteolus]